MADEERNENGSYKFEPMDVRAKVSDVVGALKSPVQRELSKREGKRLSKAQYVPHNRMDVSATADQTMAEPGVEGTDSEGKKKSLIR